MITRSKAHALRLILISIMMCILPVCSCAQWYLFPGKKKPVEQQKQSTKPVEELPETKVSEKNEPQEKNESQKEYQGLFSRLFVDIPSTIELSLLLPLKAESEKPSSNFLEMYSGALLAARDLGEDGFKLNLNCVDIAQENSNYPALASSNVIIGPVSQSDISKTLLELPEGKALVSPLDPKLAKLAATSSIVQSPTPWESQIDELLDWLKEDLRTHDELILIRDSTSNGQGDKCAYMIEALERRALPYRTVRRVGQLEMTKGHNYRILIASESDAFLAGAARSVAIEAARKAAGEIILYCSSRVRASIGGNVSDLHDASTHLTAAYHIDYEDPKVRDFVLAYRALYKTEPGSFAFQGYDLVKYYVRACAKYGRNWSAKLSDFPQRGLQSDFRFDTSVSNGRLNTAARRVLYTSDYSVLLVN